MDDNWDLYAVVRSCSATGTSSSTTTTSTTAAEATCPNVFTTFQQQDYDFSSALLQDLFATRKESLTNDELNKNNLSSQSLPISPLSVLEGFQDLSYEQQQPQCTQKKQQPFCNDFNNGSKSLQTPTSRSKRRKNHMKKVCHVPAESLSSDKWSWRKYGQKPIKGSPYPRSYYKCSTLKGCMARKQVERNRSEPGMFIVTYTAEHNHPVPTHRNSLAGITRQKLPENPSNPTTSPAPAPEKLEEGQGEVLEPEDVDDDSSASNVALDEDFFAGLEDFTGPVEAGECCSGGFPVRFDGFPMVVDF